MGQDVANVNLVSIIMQSRDQSNFVPADIEHRKFPNSIRLRKDLSQSGKTSEAVLPNNSIPVREGGLRLRMLLREFIQALPRNNMHYLGRG
jgi:hypothetical protein